MMQFRSYDFPNATIRIYRDRTCRLFPKWCLAISAEWPRAKTAEALRLLRDFRRMQRAEA